MVGTLPPATAPVAPATPSATTVPLPRRSLDASDQVRRWYENELGWPTVPDAPGMPVRLCVGPRFDVLDVPAEAGRAALRHLAPGSPVAVQGGRMRLLLAAGSADEVPGILDWLEWGSLPLDLSAIGEGGVMDAPLPPEPTSDPPTAPLPPEAGPRTSAVRPLHGAGLRRPDAPSSPGALQHSSTPGAAEAVRLPLVPRPAPPGAFDSAGSRPLPWGPSGALQGAAVWLRPPEAGCEAEASLPTLSALGGGGGAPDLVRVLDTVATQCHRLRLRACAQPPAFS
ncbi:SCO3374 family protein [Streptomyces sp. NPDC051913]|uniref:SCO3374 family protein n=1 Tax=Streptomyces sp. NPDC051913 TaxID=3365676 RepID=UPI0037D3527B